MDRYQAENELYEASEKLEEVICTLEKYEEFDSELKHYIIPQLRIRVGGEHGYLTMDKGIRDVIENVVERVEEEQLDQEEEE